MSLKKFIIQNYRKYATLDPDQYFVSISFNFFWLMFKVYLTSKVILRLLHIIAHDDSGMHRRYHPVR